MMKYKQGECPYCPSSDAFTTWEDGHSYCFSCKTTVPSEDREAKEVMYEYIPHRGLTKDTLSFYNIVTEIEDGKAKADIFNYSSTARKYRLLADKKFWWEGSAESVGLFGKDKFDPGSKDSITITAGEYDAASILQVTGGATASVSVKSGSSAKRDCIRDYDYINSFKKIILAFDNDPADRKAFDQVTSLFDPNKVFCVFFERYKDANDYLQNKESGLLFQAWKGARKNVPEGVIHTFSEIRAALKRHKDTRLAEYPFSFLQEALHGLHEGEFVLFKGLEGIGKTEVFRAIEYHTLTTTKHNTAIIRLEESEDECIRGLVTYHLKAPAMMDDSGISEEDVFKAYTEVVEGDENRLFIKSSFLTDDPDTILSNIRFLVSACGVRLVFLDHLSILVTGMEDDDERKKLDYIVTQLKRMCVALKFCIVGIIHVNDNGQTRSSRYPPKVANSVIHLERDIKHPDPYEKSKLKFIVEKGRGQGTKTGFVGEAVYDDSVSYTLFEVKPDFDKEMFS